MNVIGSRPTGWWRDRESAIRQLVRRLETLAGIEGRQVTVVIDGRPLPGLPEGEHDGVEILYGARLGRNAADDRIVEVVESESNHSRLEVVTADRELSERVRGRGAAVSGPTELLRRLDELEAL